MLILVNILIQDMELDLILVYFFGFQLFVALKMPLFLEDKSSSVYTNNKNKDILIFGKGETRALDNTTLTAQEEYSINFSRSEKNFSF